MPVMWLIVLEGKWMERFEREKRYQTMMHFAAQMLQNGVIDQEDYHDIEALMREKYCPIFVAG